MADITIAEFNGNGWLVGGEEHIDGLLANMLEDDVSIEFISCDSLEAIRALWRQNCRPGDSGGDMSNPWLIHPAIITRTRRKAPDHAVFFAQWSAQIDQHAAAVIRAAAVVAAQNPKQPVQIAEYLDDPCPRAVADLSRLRAGLVEDALIAEGVDAERLIRIRRPTTDVPGIAQESQRVDIVIVPG